MANSTQRIDVHLSDYDFTERHSIDLEGTEAEVYDVARHLDFSNSSITRRLFSIRGMDFGGLSIEAMTADGEHFKIIDEAAPHEYVIGMLGDGRNPTIIRDAAHFAELNSKYGVKIAWNFRTEPLGNGITRLHTETRTKCFGRATKLAFSVYWLFVKPFSGLIRKEMLKAAKNQLLARESVLTD